MALIHSKLHREIVGSVNNAPYVVSFDADGFADVDDSIAKQLTNGRYGVILLDENGAVVPNGFVDQIEEEPVEEEPVIDEKPSTKKKKSGSDI